MTARTRIPSTAALFAYFGVILLVLQTCCHAFLPAALHPTRRESSSSLASKNSDRAHIERNFENMMGNDWREFRAKLVAQEKAEAASPPSSSRRQQQQEEKQNNNHNNNNHHHKELTKQGQLGDLFGAAISSIFQSKQQHVIGGHHSNAHRSKNIFDGDTIGGIIADTDMSNHEDPFVSAAELPLLLKPRKSIDKHRWAHDIPHVEPGSVLIANEKLGGVFHQTVVLIVQHNDQTGSIGVVINR